MLKFRNISLLRRIYVWGLNQLTRIAYGPDQRGPFPDGEPDVQRIRRINSELEFGPSAWKKSFLESSGSVRHPNGQNAFQLEDITSFISDGVEAIAGDTLTRCFVADPTHPWNFLTRNIPPGRWQMTPYQSLLWLVGMWARYCVFLPMRTVTLIVGAIFFVLGWLFVNLVPGAERKRFARKWLLRYLASVVVASWSGYIKYHGQRPHRRPKQIYVANHTSLIDLFILQKDYNFSCIGQRHGGLAGALQDLLLAAQEHVWFDREEGSDRRAVHRLLKDHVSNGNKEPMLVFPEGTCTNSEYCVMFKKGSFELGAQVYPIAIKYRRRFGDPFWNSQTTSFPRHLFELMTSWAVVCDVYYMEPQSIGRDESAVQFANRVKLLICERAGLISVNWDGFLKRHRISPKFLDSRQQALASVITRRLNGELPRAVSSSVLAESGFDGRLPQTTGVNGGTMGGGMDSLGFDKPVGGEIDGSPRRGSLYADMLRRRMSETRRRGRRGIGFVEQVMRGTIRWVVGIGLLVGASILTSRFMPVSWKEALRPRFS